MNFSFENVTLWSGILQIAILCVMLVFANILRRKVAFFRKSLVPTAVLAGFIALGLRYLGILPVDPSFMETITYHSIALGFIALSLKTPQKFEGEKANLTGPRSGALIASTYVLQGIVGLIITIGLAYTFMPNLFKAAGVLLPMGYGQGPGQANNIGITYENLGFSGGQDFGLSIAATGFLVAYIIGVIYLNILKKQGKIKTIDTLQDNTSGSITVEQFQDKNEIPVSESVDKLSMNVALVFIVYGMTYLLSRAITSGLLVLGGFAETLISLIWGFNFLIGVLLALCVRQVIIQLRKKNIMTRQYQNNYLLSRLSGVAFDFMIISGISAIEFEKLAELWVPFIILTTVGAIVTFIYLRWICKYLYPGYYQEGFISMFGNLTGTIGSGILLLRELDHEFHTPAANNLLLGSTFGIAFGGPILILVGIAPTQPLLVLGILVAYFVFLLAFMLKFKRKKKND